MTLEDSLTAVRTLMRDAALHQTDTSVLSSWLEQGQKDTASYTYCYQRLATWAPADSPQALKAYERSYTLSGTVAAGGLGLTDYLWALHVTWNGIPLLRWTPPMSGVADAQADASGTPRFYQVFADHLILLPYPGTVEIASVTMQLMYAALPGTWASGAGVLPVGPDTGPIWFTLSRVAMEQRRWTLAARWYKEYLGLMTRVRLQQLTQMAQAFSADQMPTDSERTDVPRRMQVVRLAQAQARQARRRA